QKTAVAEGVDHSVLMVAGQHKKDLLMHLLAEGEKERVIVFVRTKATADSLKDEIAAEVETVKAAAIHGDEPQPGRERTLRSFRNGRFSVLVATDVAARGIDVSGITHVINYDLPMEAENYIHRVGRTGRAGASGIAISICEPRERNLLRNIEQILKQKVRIDEDHPFPAPQPKPAAKKHHSGGWRHSSDDGRKRFSAGGADLSRDGAKKPVRKNQRKAGLKPQKSARPAAYAKNKSAS